MNKANIITFFLLTFSLLTANADMHDKGSSNTVLPKKEHRHYWVSSDQAEEVRYESRKKSREVIKKLPRIFSRSKESLPVLKIHNGIRK